jgi:tRNA nucleotidyltransferase (CCA-adding enzyme)
VIDAVYRALEADPPARVAFEALTAAGAEVYAVGGAVRDALLGAHPKDVDLLAAGLAPDEVERTLAALPGRVDFTGASFGVFRYRNRRREVEVALPRTERSSGPGHRDFDVVADHRLGVEDDLARRDFTANALAVELRTGRLVDPFGGRADIEARVLRTVSPASFREDPLRIVRALVALARHGLVPDAETRRQMGEHADALAHLPQERIRLELEKLLAAHDPAAGIELARSTGVLGRILPEVDACFGFDQRTPHHDLELGAHLLAVLRAMTRLSPEPELRLAALLHDVGKPASQWVDARGIAHYYAHAGHPGSADHAELGARLARAALRRLRFPVDTIERVARLVRLHMFGGFDSPRGARRFLRRAGSNAVARDLLLLREADKVGRPEALAKLGRMHELVERELAAAAAFSLADLAVDGSDLLAAGVPQGPEVGHVLRKLLDRVVDEPELNERETLLGLVRELTGQRR